MYHIVLAFQFALPKALSDFEIVRVFEVKSWPGLVAAGLSMLTGIFMLVTGPADVVGSQASFSDGTETKSHDATPMSSQGDLGEMFQLS